MTATKMFENDGMYPARFMESNRSVYIMNVKRDGDNISFIFNQASHCNYDFSVKAEDVIAIEDGCERLLFKSPSGKAVVCYADKRLYDDKYLRTHEVT